MKPSLFQRMDLWVRQLLPLGTTLMLLLINVIPTRVPGFAGVAPVLVMMGVYYWTIYRPDLLSPLTAFLVGLAHDILSGTPLGVTAAVLLMVQGVTESQRRFFLGSGFAASWWGFGLVSLVAVSLQWVLVSAVFGQVLESRVVLFSYLMTLSLYPAVSWVLARTHVMFLRH